MQNHDIGKVRNKIGMQEIENGNEFSYLRTLIKNYISKENKATNSPCKKCVQQVFKKSTWGLWNNSV